MLLGLPHRAGLENVSPTVREHAVVQALTFPPVRLAVEAELAIDLPAVLAEGPDVFSGLRLPRRRRSRVVEHVLWFHVGNRRSGD